MFPFSQIIFDHTDSQAGGPFFEVSGIVGVGYTHLVRRVFFVPIRTGWGVVFK